VQAIAVGQPAAAAVRLSLACIGLMFTLPFLQPRHYEPLALFWSEWLALVLGMAAFVPLVLARPAPRVEVPWIAAVPLGLAAVVAAQLALGRIAYPQQGLIAVLYLAWAAALMVLGRYLRRECGLPALAVALAWCLVAGAVLTAVAGMLQHYELRGPLASVIVSKVSHRVYGNLVQPNHFVAYLALGIASLGYLYARGRVSLSILAVLSVPLVLALAVAGSLSAWLYLAAFTVLGAALLFNRCEPGHRRLLLYCLSVAGGFVLAQWLAQLPGLAGATPTVTAAGRLSDIAAPTSIGVRLGLWREAWDMWRQAPWLGVGWGQFAWEHFLRIGAAAGQPLPGLYHHAHNVVMQILAECGLAGVAILLGGVVAWFAGLRRGAFDAELWWVLAVLAVPGLHGMIEYPLWYAYFLGVTAVLLGAADARERVIAAGRMPRLVATVTLLAGGFIAAHTGARYHALELAHNPGVGDVAQQEAAQEARNLLSARGGLMDPWIELAVARTLGMDRMAIDTKIAFSAQVMRFLPTAVIAYQHALLLALKGEERESLELLDRAFASYPRQVWALVAEVEGLGEADRAALAPFIGRLRQHVATCRAAKTCPRLGGRTSFDTE